MTIYYTVSSVPIAQTRGVSSSIRSEYSLIATGFANVNTDMLLRGAIAGQTWTGTHSFTGATITVPTASAGSSGSAAASLDFVNAVVASPALPGQAGKTDYFLTTDGSNASFSNLLKSTVIRFADGADTTKRVSFTLSGITTGTTRAVTIPNKDGTMAMLSDLIVSYLSADQTITAAGALTLAHSLGAQPKIVQGFLKCGSAEGGYSIGDILSVQTGPTDPANGRGVSVVSDATNLYVRYGSNGSSFSVLNKTTGASLIITDANWTFHLRAFA